MGKRTVVLIVALLVAGLAAFSVWAYLGSIEDDIKADIEELTVFRATTLIQAGVEGATALPLIEESVENAEFIPPAAITDRATLEETLTGTITAGPVSEQSIITTDMWIVPSEFESARLTELISPGKIAISINPSQVAAAGGYIKPGDRVSMIASRRLSIADFTSVLGDDEARTLLGDLLLLETELQQATQEQPVPVPGETPEDVTPAVESTLLTSWDFTQTVVQDLEVLAVGDQIRDATPGTGLVPVGSEIIVLEVTPQQAELVTFAQQYSSVTLTLVPDGYTPFESRGVVVDDLFSLVERLLGRLEDLGGG